MGTQQQLDADEKVVMEEELGEVGAELLAQWAHKAAKSWFLSGGGATLPAVGLADVMDQQFKETIEFYRRMLQDGTLTSADHDHARRLMATARRLLRRVEVLRGSHHG